MQTPSSTRTLLIVSERTRGLLDTSALVDLELLEPSLLPDELAIAAITLAELSAGPTQARDALELSRRQVQLQMAEAAFDPLPFGVAEARAYGRVVAAVVAQGRKPRRRFADLLIAATALANDLTLVTRNPDDFVGLEDLVTIRTV